ncbi:hypothetical protein SY88_10035 [Clostridiales bacterium PH28_bin88]|nr:hypothetical protein SY88_14365 [Clostridiales bacterium PH28_bin88]KKM11168.1 hypothetical protein SY88_10035 [Clostridiales bacterium PH28_bin88]
MLCSKDCGSEADVFFRTDKVFYPLCAHCYLKDSKLPREVQERIRGFVERADGQRSDQSGSQ